MSWNPVRISLDNTKMVFNRNHIRRVSTEKDGIVLVHYLDGSIDTLTVTGADVSRNCARIVNHIGGKRG